jgi:molybdate transport system permease protein
MNADDAQVIGLTLGTAALSTLLIFPFGVALAWLLARKEWPGKSLVETVVALPLVMPPVATGLILLNLLGRRGPIGAFRAKHVRHGNRLHLEGGGRGDGRDVVPLSGAHGAARLRGNQSAAGTNVARTLGAGPARVFLTITLPLAARGMVAGAVWAFARALGEFGATILVAGNIPGRTTVCRSRSTATSSSGRTARLPAARHLRGVLAFAAIFSAINFLKWGGAR